MQSVPQLIPAGALVTESAPWPALATDSVCRTVAGAKVAVADLVWLIVRVHVGFVTVVGVKVSPDLRHAWVSYTSLGDEKAKAGTRAALRSARPHLRRVIGRQVRLKYLPDLEFEEDTTYEQARRIDELIGELPRSEEER